MFIAGKNSSIIYSRALKHRLENILKLNTFPITHSSHIKTCRWNGSRSFNGDNSMKQNFSCIFQLRCNLDHWSSNKVDVIFLLSLMILFDRLSVSNNVTIYLIFPAPSVCCLCLLLFVNVDQESLCYRLEITMAATPNQWQYSPKKDELPNITASFSHLQSTRVGHERTLFNCMDQQ